MSLINQKTLKKMLKKQDIKIGKEVSKMFIKRLEDSIDKEAEKATRNAKISGRKILKQEDFIDP